MIGSYGLFPLPETLSSSPSNSCGAQFTGHFLKEALPDHLSWQVQAPVKPTLRFSFTTLAVQSFFLTTVSPAESQPPCGQGLCL